MRGGAFLGFVGGAFLGLAGGFVAFSGGPDAEAIAVDVSGDSSRADARKGGDAEVERPALPEASVDSPAPEERSLAAAPRALERAPSSADPAGEGVLSGRVTDGDGAPVEGVLLRIERFPERELDAVADPSAAPDDRSLDEVLEEAAEDWNRRQATRREATTGADGTYRFDALEDGRYSLRAHARGYALESRSGPTWSVRPGAVVNFKALPVVEVPFTVRGPSGAKMESVGLRMTSERGGASKTTEHLWRSEDRTLRLAPGRVSLKAFVDLTLAKRLRMPEMTSDEKLVDVVAGASPEPVVLDLRLQAGIRGRVLVPDDAVLHQARVVLVPVPATGAVDPAWFENGDTSTWLGGGRLEFEFLELKPGRYAVGLTRGWNSPAVAHAVADVTEGMVAVDIVLPKDDAAPGLVVRVRNHAGEPVEVQGFTYTFHSGYSTHSSHLQSNLRGPGEYAVELDTRLKSLFDGTEPLKDARIALRVHSRRMGEKTVPLPIDGSRRELDVVFLEPATLNVAVAGFVGSGLEGQLDLHLARTGDDETGAIYSFGSEGGIAADGTRTLGPVEVGDYRLELKLRDRRNGYWSDRTLAALPVRLGPGENSSTIAVPPLYALTIRFDAAGGNMQLTGEAGLHVHREIVESAVVVEALPAGRYTIRRWGAGGDGTMTVSVPEQHDVRFQVAARNGLAVQIQDPKAWIAGQGFQSGDVIVAFAGEEFSSETAMRGVWTAAVKAGRRGATVLRGGQRLTLDVDLGELMVKGEEGASLRPSSR